MHRHVPSTHLIQHSNGALLRGGQSRKFILLLTLLGGGLAIALGLYSLSNQQRVRKYKSPAKKRIPDDAIPAAVAIDQEEKDTDSEESEEDTITGGEAVGGSTSKSSTDTNHRRHHMRVLSDWNEEMNSHDDLGKALGEVVKFMEEEQVKEGTIARVREKLSRLEEQVSSSHKLVVGIEKSVQEALSAQQHQTNAAIGSLKKDVAFLKAEMQRIVNLGQQLAVREGVLEEKVEASSSTSGVSMMASPITPHSPDYGLTDWSSLH